MHLLFTVIGPLIILLSTRFAFFKGKLHFTSPNDFEHIEMTVEPRVGDVVIFSSGPENPHFVERVTSGQRFVLAFWFTCDPSREFEIFLDGKSHVQFTKRVKASMEQKQRQQQQQQKSEL